jgi:Uma2 family endonuclease
MTVMTAEVHWPRPPADGYTADDLDRLPDLPAHTELIDGSLIFVSPQKRLHMLANRRLENGLLRCAPDWAAVGREVTIRIAERQRPEPDLVVLRAGSMGDDETLAYYPAEAVVLAVETVSPESEIRDRERKPVIYAQAGIEHFWLVEHVADNALSVTTFRLDHEAVQYVQTGVHHDRLQVIEPFPIDIDLTDIARP